MVKSFNEVSFELTKKCPGCLKAIITIPQKVSSELYREAINAQKKEIQTFGFPKGQTPEYYIEQNYKAHINEHLKSFLFHYFAVDSLYHSIMQKKIILANEPELESMEITPESNTIFTFILDTHEEIEKQDWKNSFFKAPSRKNYKDIDRQVENFIETETKEEKETELLISVGDWICFDVQLLNAHNKPIFNNEQETLWLKIGSEEVDKEIRNIFEGKKVGETFITKSQTLQEYFSDKIDTQYHFSITIRAIVAHSYFDFNNLKKHFNLKTTKDLHRKLIEAFSFRNDISQRRETVEKTFKHLINLYKFQPREYLIDQQKKRVLKAVQQNPDYYVYKSEKNFKETLHALAEKQLKEIIVIDFIAYHENIKVEIEDISYYLTLNQRARTKMFIYFNLPSTKINGQEMPISHAQLKHICLREKALNHIIHTLTKKR